MRFCQASENNKHAILSEIKSIFAQSTCVLEIGSGTGQHAVFFAAELTHLTWVPSDMPVNHSTISAWIDAFPAPNIESPICLSFPEPSSGQIKFDGVFTANTAHIMQQHEVKSMMEWVGQHLPSKGHFCQYGPFRQHGIFSTQSNRIFHERLLSEGYGGYRDIQELESWAPDLELVAIHDMPANNHLLHWQKK